VGGAVIPTALACADAAKGAVACDATNVRSATLTPATPLVPGQHYEVVVNPAGAVTVTDVAGNPAATKTTAFRGALVNQEWSAAASYRWKRVATTKALGGSYVVEHRAGATAAWSFTGTAVTWVTATGPSSGRAQVWVDGVKQRAVNNYAAGAHWKVARTITGLSAGTHTVKIVVLGRKGATGAKDTQVVVDGFKVGTTTTASPSLRLTWPRGTSAKASGGAFARDDLAGASTTFRFRGTGVTWISATGPAFGKAAVFIDGKRVRRVDSWSATAKFKVGRSFTGLSDTVHTIRVKVLGRHRAAATGNMVVVDGWRVA
jgi:bacillopeptidase F